MFGIGGSELVSILYLFLFFIPGFWAANVAKAKGRSGVAWFFIGLFFCLIGVIVAYLVPAKDGGDYLKCPYCAELIKKEAVVCKHCHKDIAQPVQG